jgi:hypothetical protein
VANWPGRFQSGLNDDQGDVGDMLKSEVPTDRFEIWTVDSHEEVSVIGGSMSPAWYR